MRTIQSIVLLSALSLTASSLFAADIQNATAPASAPQPAAASADAKPASASEELHAIVMQTEGQAQWRPNETAEWADAKVDDTLTVGAQVRTGLRSSMTLRVGQNATVRIDRSSRLDLPRILKEGDTLTTRTAIRYGRAEFKVDKVGLTNDFAVITPTTTLAVRGTGFAVEWGAWGSKVTGVATNELNAIEIRYILNQVKVYLSKQGSSSNKNPNQVNNALANSVGIPPQWTALLDSDLVAKLKDAGFITESSAKNLRDVDLENTSSKWVDNYLTDLVASLDQGPNYSQIEIVCYFLNTVLDDFRGRLEADGGNFKPYRIERFNEMKHDIQDICRNIDSIDGDPFEQVVDRVRDFCADITNNKGTEGCTCEFIKAVNEVLKKKNKH
ncbi:MAG TPA: FecR domain-containing protein [Phycisphaerales bacterium]|nr:FecR domain-containing protein [Phycisphaerales bacterium]